MLDRTAGSWWRSHTFMDGTREIVLSARFGPVVAGALHARLCELTDCGCERIVLDLSTAGALGAEELRLLAGALTGQPPGCRIALVVPQHVEAVHALGKRVYIAGSPSQARRMLQAAESQEPRTPAGTPAGPLSPPDRHALAVRQSLRWAAVAAAEGDYDTALSWLEAVETVDGSLTEEWLRRKQAWTHAHRIAGARQRLHSPGGRPAGGMTAY